MQCFVLQQRQRMSNETRKRNAYADYTVSGMVTLEAVLVLYLFEPYIIIVNGREASGKWPSQVPGYRREDKKCESASDLNFYVHRVHYVHFKPMNP